MRYARTTSTTPRGPNASAFSHTSGQRAAPRMRDPLGPTQDAYEMADYMLSSPDELDAVLAETLASINEGDVRESGRTFCSGPSSILGPHARFPRAVELQECPFGSAGVVHSHVTPNELLQPEHSLPDMSNVLFTEIDASIVLGAETSDVMYAPTNEAEARDAFRDALGVRADSTEDVVDAIENNEIDSEPDARQRIRRSLAPLFETVDTAFQNHAHEVRQMQQGVTASAVGGRVNSGCMAYLHAMEPYNSGRAGFDMNDHINGSFEGHLDDMERTMKDGEMALVEATQGLTEGVNLRAEIIGSAIGAIVAGLVSIYVFKGR